eukprot:TRINITY_DN4115_c0_g2_i1.p1 TRINITY_DN4115_c0_g2~~TRINITY_DN4115_c0_g2_i1.p1  ORF type:complete len:2759 (+),score=599.54 TRINITY_DN4115_c0_g2_i1:192-8468(+)
MRDRLQSLAGVSTIVHALRIHATDCPDQDVLVYLGDDGTESQRLTFSQLDCAASIVAQQLSEHGLKLGDHAVIVCPPSIEFVLAYFGCLYAGVIAVPLYPPLHPSRIAKELPRFQAVFDDCGATVVLSTTSVQRVFQLQALLPFASALRTTQGSSIDWISVSGVLKKLHTATPRDLSHITSETVAFIQYSSGSTGTPKGVLLTHGNLFSNIMSLLQLFSSGGRSLGYQCTIAWLPPFHDMGLIGTILTPVVTCSLSVQMSPMAFLRRPSLWFEAVTRYKGTIMVGPNFGLAYTMSRVSRGECARIGADLSSVHTILCGAEPIQLAAVRRFAETYAPFGLNADAIAPCYGLAEATLAVSSKPLAVPFRHVCLEVPAMSQNRVVLSTSTSACATIDIVSCGRPIERVEIVNPKTRQVCAPNEIGEIWVHGPSVSSLGYWQRDKLTKQTFGGQLSPSDGRRYLRTGDYGFLLDGELYCTGRMKDIIIVRGRNIYPQDIEHAAETAHAVMRKGSAVAFAVEAHDGDTRVVLAIEVNNKPDDTAQHYSNVSQAIRTAVNEALNVDLAAILLVRARTIPKTTSGKVRRFACRLAALQATARTVALAQHRQKTGDVGDIPTLDVVAMQVYQPDVANALKTTYNVRPAFTARLANAVKVPFRIAVFIPMMWVYLCVYVCQAMLRAMCPCFRPVIARLSRRTSPSALNVTTDVSSVPAASPVCPSPHSALISESEPTITSAASATLSDELAWLGNVSSASRVLASYIAHELQFPVESVDIHAPLAGYGLDSTRAVALVGALSDKVGQPLPVTLLYDCASVHALAVKLVDWKAGRFSFSEPSDAGEVGRENSNDNRVAVVGIGCTVPGANSPSEFWNLLQSQADAVRQIPRSRADLKESLGDKLLRQSRDVHTISQGGWLDDVLGFDAPFFGISAREASVMDPQQRLALQVAYHAFQDANVPVGEQAQNIGVFVGVSNSDFAHLQFASGLQSTKAASATSAFAASGAATSVLAGRLSYCFNLTGPSMVVDTACSSSLIAVHNASRCITAGDCEVALAGGVNLIQSLQLSHALASAGFLSPDGRCKAFDVSADGYVRGEGVAFVVLKAYAAAVRDGDRIYAVVAGGAVNQDGRSNGLTAPNGTAQERVIQRALQDAQISAGQLSFVEAHGTGTLLGDPVEVGAIASVLSRTTRPNPLAIGSVKSNIGHLEAASGICGLIKAALALHHCELPATLHCKQISPHLQLGKQIEVATTSRKLSADSVAGVSSFGFSGTNCHLVLKSHTAKQLPAKDPLSVLTISAKSTVALKQLCKQYAALLHGTTSAEHVVSICRASTLGRSKYRFCVTTAVSEAAVTAQRLEEFEASTELPESIYYGQSTVPPKVAFVFSGQGRVASLAHICELIDRFPAFASAFRQCDAALQAADVQLLPSIRQGGHISPLLEQPLLFAMQFAQAALWRSWGIEPAAVIGHSVGELAAAVVSGHLPLAAGARLIAIRASLLQRLHGKGSLLAVKATLRDTERVIGECGMAFNGDRRTHDYAVVCADNAPNAVVIAGSTLALSSIQTKLLSLDITHKQLAVDVAFHTPQVDMLKSEFMLKAASIFEQQPSATSASNVAFFSSTRGAFLDVQQRVQLCTAAYWYDNMRQMVSFRSATEKLFDDEVTVALELGHGPLLMTAMHQTAKALRRDTKLATVAAISSVSDRLSECLSDSVARLVALGAPIQWQGVYSSSGPFVDLPLYPFDTAHEYALPFANLEHSVQRPLKPRLSVDEHSSGSGGGGGGGRGSSPSRRLQTPPSPPPAAAEPAPSSEEQSQEDPQPITLSQLAELQLRLTPLHASDEIVLSELNTLCLAYAVKALKQLGVPLHAGAILYPNKLLQQHGIVPKYERLLQRLLWWLQNARCLEHVEARMVDERAMPDAYEVSQFLFDEYGEDVSQVVMSPQRVRRTLQYNSASAPPSPVMRQVPAEPHFVVTAGIEKIVQPTSHSHNPAYQSLFALLNSCAPHLSAVLTGKQDALEVLFAGGSADAVAAVYNASPIARLSNDVISQIIAFIATTVSSPSIPVRVLELGAGTGGTTSAILPLLSDLNVQYVMTDISRTLVTRARESIAVQYPFVSCELLDIENDVTSQGFGKHYFDVVLAANVLHATCNLPQTLAHARSLLKPNGLLVILEITTPTMFLDMTFGLTDGWWRFKDSVRSTNPLLTSDVWQQQLLNAGFADAAVMPHTTAHNAPPFLSVLVARCAEDAVNSIQPSLSFTTTQRDGPVYRAAAGLQQGAELDALMTMIAREPPASQAEIRVVLIKFLRVQIAAAMGVAVTEVLANTNLLELGADSLMLLELKQSLCEELGVDIPLSAVIQRPTVSGIAAAALDLQLQSPKPHLKPAAAARSTPVRSLAVVPSGARASILAIGTAVPKYSEAQARTAEYFIHAMKIGSDAAACERVRRIFEHAMIERRYSVLPDILYESETATLWARSDGADSALMEERNAIFVREAPLLALDAARKAMQEWGGAPSDITHVIACSSTGTIIPGIELRLLETLGLRRDTQRFGMNFHGCFGALSSLRAAEAIARTGGRVLLVCVELCTLHFRFNMKTDNVVATAIFADGAAATIVGCATTASERPAFEIVQCKCTSVPGTMDAMRWDLTTYGWEVGLDITIPDHIQRHTAAFIDDLQHLPDSTEAVCNTAAMDFAIHPGGKTILECVEVAAGLRREQTKHSWDVLRDYGNMSSGTVLFVMDQLRRDPHRKEWAVGMAFGPGLSMEGVLLRKPT